MSRSTREHDVAAPPASSGTRLGGERALHPVRPAFLHGRHGTFVAMLHATVQARPDVGVVICPPFGWEEMASYRPRREWAQALAERGVAALRIDLPGTGDSDGYPTDDGRLDAWTGALGDGAVWLRHETGCRRVVALGIGVGGLLAYTAAAQGAPIDDLVLWGAPARGRKFIRELKAFARMEAIQQDKDDEGPRDELPDGWLSAGGYVITAETCAALEALDASELPLPSAAGRHALLIERDGISIDTDLREALERQQVSVAMMPGEGYGRMMVEPQLARAPAALTERVVAWIAALEPSTGPLLEPGPRGDVGVPRASAEAQVHAPDGTLVKESFLAIEHPLGEMFGVLTEPLEGDRDTTALLIGGTGHRIGPNRMWVEAARRWAAWGVPSVRLDLAGAGDAGGVQAPDVPALHNPELTEQLNLALRELTQMGLSSHAITVGLCIGAYWAFQASLQTDQKVVPLMLNPRVLVWDEGYHVDRMARHYLSELRHASNWKRLFNGDAHVTRALGAVMRRLKMTVVGRGGSRGHEQASKSSELTDSVLDELRDRGRRALLLFTGHEPLLQELEREGRLERMQRWPNLTLEVVPGLSDLHTLRQIWLQQKVHELLDAALQRELTDGKSTGAARSLPSVPPRTSRSMTQLRDLYVSTYAPALGSGRALRTYTCIRALAMLGPVDLAYVAFDGDEPSSEYQSIDGLALHEIKPSRGARRAGVYLSKRARGIPAICCRGTSPELIDLATRLAAAPGRGRVIVGDLNAATALMPLARHRPVIYNAHNIESEYVRTGNDPRVVHRATMRRYERRLLALAAESWMVSRADLASAQILAPGAQLRYAPNAVDVTAIVPPKRDGRNDASHELLMVGDFIYGPNQSGRDWLIDQIMPLVLRELPDARLTLAGRGLEDWSAPISQVHVAGFVPSLDPLYAASDCVVVPLTEGAGSPLKFIEAMAYAMPIVATPLAGRGLEALAGVHYREGADPASFAAEVVDVLRHGGASMASAARELAEREYSIEALAERLVGDTDSLNHLDFDREQVLP
jgi:glycosyltransferase involved in cell wall biosynthesis/pimeloyl-ACP methyl ester carboxylesterase